MMFDLVYEKAQPYKYDYENGITHSDYTHSILIILIKPLNLLLCSYWTYDYD